MQVVDTLVELGAVISHVSMPHTEYTLPAYYIVAPAEASSNLARYDGVRYGNRAPKTLSHEDLAEKTREQGFGPEVKRRILIGTYALSAGYYDAFYHKAMQVRTLIQQDFLKAFEHVDVLITPTTPTTAFGIGEKSDDPLAMKLSDIWTETEGELQVRLDTGQTYVWNDAFLSGDRPTITEGEGGYEFENKVTGGRIPREGHAGAGCHAPRLGQPLGVARPHRLVGVAGHQEGGG